MQLGNEGTEFIFYTETRFNQTPNIKKFIVPIKCAISRGNKISIDIELCKPKELVDYIEFLNNNMEIYSRIALQMDDGTTVKIK